MRISPAMILLGAITTLAGLGCARYEYDIVRPPEFAGHVGREMDYSFERGPVRYLLRSVDNRLVMRIYNSGDEPILLLGRVSSVVDPEGESHPLRTQTIAPDSYVTLVFPPRTPRFYRRPGFNIGVGVGTRVQRDAPGEPLASGDEPRYLTIVHQYNDDEELGAAYYWDWDGQGETRLNLVFDLADERVEHDFVIRRVKV